MDCFPPSVLLLADAAAAADNRDVFIHVLTEAGLACCLVEVGAGSDHQALDRLGEAATERQPATILLLCSPGCGDRQAFVTRLLHVLPRATPIIVAGDGFDSDEVCALYALGIDDVVLPPFVPAAVVPRVWRLIHPVQASVPGRGRGPRVSPHLGLHGQSPAFLGEVEKLPLMAGCDVTVLISGETGTGKELIARAIHYLSRRHDEPFVPIDCGAMPADLAESELFGHERGAFTGAATRTPGLIASARQGTIFLDEVQALSPIVQAKLLRFLQEHEYRPLGSSEVRKADVRILSASNCDLRDLVRRGEFREDLFYRLNVIHVRLPALRERPEDVLLLARHFIAKHSARFGKRPADLSRAAIQRLLAYAWPGNVRELEHVLEAAIVLCRRSTIDADDLRLGDAGGTPATRSFREAKALAVREFERSYIIRMLRASGGNITAAARAAKKNRRAFWELLRKYRLDTRAAIAAEGDATSERQARAG
jgi:two-component system, NtrC family, response regulator GlrR